MFCLFEVEINRLKWGTDDKYAINNINVPGRSIIWKYILEFGVYSLPIALVSYAFNNHVNDDENMVKFSTAFNK